MKVLYFDCFAGISGDMILGALLDAGLDENEFRAKLSGLKLKGFEIEVKKSISKGISGTNFNVKVDEDHHRRGLKDIFQIIDDSDLKAPVKEKSKKIFQRLGEVEAKIHNKDSDEIHFHEVGAVDSIVDIVGSVIALEMLEIEKVMSSKIHLGTGTLKCAHGILPVPAPATLELLKDASVYSTGINAELTTPTGATIITTLSKYYGSLPDFTIEKIGFGIGTHNLDIPNFIRVVTGNESVGYSQDTIQLIETNIDDMNPQYYDYMMELLFEAGAKDVYLNPVIMKKNRPGVILSVLTSPELVEELASIILQETTALGVRISELKKRKVLRREQTNIETSFGMVRVKIKELISGEKIISPEYDDCTKIAKEKNIPIRNIYNLIDKEIDLNREKIIG